MAFTFSLRDATLAPDTRNIRTLFGHVHQPYWVVDTYVHTLYARFPMDFYLIGIEEEQDTVGRVYAIRTIVPSSVRVRFNSLFYLLEVPHGSIITKEDGTALNIGDVIFIPESIRQAKEKKYGNYTNSNR